jgi:hypothetical protein
LKRPGGAEWTARRIYVSIPGARRSGAARDNSCDREYTAMTNNKFTVGIKLDGRRHSVTVAAEDALVAALKVKLEQPAAAINFVRRCNRRGDLRHPHGAIAAALQPS